MIYHLTCIQTLKDLNEAFQGYLKEGWWLFLLLVIGIQNIINFINKKPEILIKKINIYSIIGDAGGLFSRKNFPFHYQLMFWVILNLHQGLFIEFIELLQIQ